MPILKPIKDKDGAHTALVLESDTERLFLDPSYFPDDVISINDDLRGSSSSCTTFPMGDELKSKLTAVLSNESDEIFSSWQINKTPRVSHTYCLKKEISLKKLMREAKLRFEESLFLRVSSQEKMSVVVMIPTYAKGFRRHISASLYGKGMTKNNLELGDEKKIELACNAIGNNMTPEKLEEFMNECVDNYHKSCA